MTKDRAKDTEVRFLRGNQSIKEVEEYIDSLNIDKILKESLDYLNQENFENDLKRLAGYENETFKKINAIITRLEIKQEEEKLKELGSAKGLKYKEATLKAENALDEFRIAANNKYIQTLIDEAFNVLKGSENTSEVIDSYKKVQEISEMINQFNHFAEQQGWSDPNREINASYSIAMDRTYAQYNELQRSCDAELISSYSRDIKNIIKQASLDLNDIPGLENHLEKTVVEFKNLGSERQWDNNYLRKSVYERNLKNAYDVLDILKVLSQPLSATPNSELTNDQRSTLTVDNGLLPLSTLYSKLDQLNVEELNQSFQNLLSESNEFKKNKFINNLEKLAIKKPEESNRLLDAIPAVKERFIDKIMNTLKDKTEARLKNGGSLPLEGNADDKAKLSSQDPLTIVRAMLNQDFIQSNPQWTSVLKSAENNALNFELNSIYNLVNNELAAPSLGGFFHPDKSTQKELQQVRDLANIGGKNLSTEELLERASSIKTLLSHEGFFNRCKWLLNEVQRIVGKVLLFVEQPLKNEKLKDLNAADAAVAGLTKEIKNKTGHIISEKSKSDVTSTPTTDRKWRI